MMVTEGPEYTLQASMTISFTDKMEDDGKCFKYGVNVKAYLDEDEGVYHPYMPFGSSIDTEKSKKERFSKEDFKDYGASALVCALKSPRISSRGLSDFIEHRVKTYFCTKTYADKSKMLNDLCDQLRHAVSAFAYEGTQAVDYDGTQLMEDMGSMYNIPASTISLVRRDANMVRISGNIEDEEGKTLNAIGNQVLAADYKMWWLVVEEGK